MFIMMVHPYHDDPKSNHSHITCRKFFQIPLDVDGIDASINNQMLENPRIILVHLAALDNGINTYIGTLNKDRGEIFFRMLHQNI